MIVEQSNVGETPQVVQDQANQRAVWQQLKRYKLLYYFVINRYVMYSYLGLGSESNEVRDKKLQGEVEDGVDV